MFSCLYGTIQSTDCWNAGSVLIWGIMHLTYHDSKPHTSEASTAKAEEAGAPGSSYGDFPAGQPSGEVPLPNPLPDPMREALEHVYYDWWGENYYALELGLPGDVLDLREKLNAAFAKASSSSLRAPRA